MRITRRDFLSKSGKTVGGLAAASLLSGAMARPAKAKVLGANERLNIAVIGIRGRGESHIESFAEMKNVHVKTLCDVDENLFADRVKLVKGYEPATEWNMKKVFDDKDIHAVSFATPNFWHALGTIWACQAGKHVYVEKPASYNIWEGRKMVEAARKYNRVVQVGFQNRSKSGVQKAIELLHKGIIGDVYMARGLCYKPRHNVEIVPDSPVPAGVHYDEWIGPAPERPFNKNRFHYEWHWQWDYGNGDIGNQGPHQFDVARWGLNKNEHPVKVRSMGGCFVWKGGIQETANTQSAVYRYADGKILQFEVRGWYTNKESDAFGKDSAIGNLFYGSEGWMVINGSKWYTYMGRNGEPGPSSETGKASQKKEEASAASADPMNLAGAVGDDIFGNFIDAVRAEDPKLLTSDIESGHISSVLPHLANISYRLDRDLTFDGKTESFVNDKEADAMLKRPVQRKNYTIPDAV